MKTTAEQRSMWRDRKVSMVDADPAFMDTLDDFFELEAACSAMRLTLEAIAVEDWADMPHWCAERAMTALSTDAGHELVDRMKKLEKVAEAARKIERRYVAEAGILSLNAALEHLDAKARP